MSNPAALGLLLGCGAAVWAGPQFVRAVSELGVSGLIFAAIFVSAMISSTVGFAFSAIAGAVLMHLMPDPVQAVKLMMVSSIVIQAYTVFSMRREIELRAVLPLLAGGVCTLPLGIALLLNLPCHAFQVTLGAFLVVYAGCTMARRKPIVIAGGRAADFAVGAVGGITGGLAAFPGAFVTIWCGMRGWDKSRQRAVFQPYILGMQLIGLPMLGAADGFAAADLQLALYAPAALLGAYAGMQIFRRMTDQQFTFTLQLLLMVSGVALLAK